MEKNKIEPKKIQKKAEESGGRGGIKKDMQLKKSQQAAGSQKSSQEKSSPSNEAQEDVDRLQVPAVVAAVTNGVATAGSGLDSGGNSATSSAAGQFDAQLSDWRGS